MSNLSNRIVLGKKMLTVMVDKYGTQDELTLRFSQMLDRLIVKQMREGMR